MKVWTFDDPRSFGARTIVRGTLKGMEEYGWSVRAAPLDPEKGTKNLRSDLVEFSPDLLFFVNQPPDLYLGQMGFTATEIDAMSSRRIVWLLDDPFLLGRDPFRSEDIVLVADPAFGTAARERGAKRVFFVPVAADIDRPGEKRDEFSAPVAYVGSVKNMDSWRRKIPPEIDRYLDKVIDHKVRIPARPVEEILRALPLAPGRFLQLDGPLAYYLYVTANNLFRISTLESLVPFGIQLFGNRDWLEVMGDSPLRDRYRGTLDPFAQTPHLYRSASVSLNLRSLQGFTAPTQRDFNVPAAGGFLLSSDYGLPTAPVCRSYWEGIRSPSFGSREEMHDKLRMYLEQPRKREDWIASVQREIYQRHRYVHRVESIAQFMRL